MGNLKLKPKIWLPTAVVVVSISLFFSCLMYGAPAWLPRADQAASLSGLMVGLCGLGVALVTLVLTSKPSRVDPEDARRQARDHLARLIEQEFDEELAVRGLVQPDPIPLRWTLATAKPTSVDSVSPLRVVRSRTEGTIATAIMDWQRLSTQQLVVIGGPGAGKSSLISIIARGILKNLKSDEPIPILLSMASWDPRSEPLNTWLVSQLELRYPALTNENSYGEGIAQALVEHRLIMPVLDGLDEVPESLQALAVTVASRFLSDRRFILSSRSKEYDRIVAKRGVLFPRAAVVKILEVSPEQASRFLIEGQIRGPERWGSVTRTITDNPRSVLALAMNSPLMVYLARTAYSSPTSNPADLLKIRKIKEVRSHLLDGYLPALYAVPKDAERAQRWLHLIARDIVAEGRTSWIWWKLVQSIPRPAFFLPVAVALSLLGGVALTLTAAPIIGSFFGLMIFLTARFTAGNERGVHPRHVSFALPYVLYGVARQSALGLATVLPVLFIGASWNFLGGALCFGLLSGIALGSAKFADPMQPVTFERSLRNDRRAFLLVFLSYAVPVGILCHWIAAKVATPVPSAIAGVAGGLSAGIAMGTAICWSRYTYVRCILASKGLLPFKLAAFLVEAHRRGILRRAGEAFEFRHDHLLKYFAVESSQEFRR